MVMALICLAVRRREGGREGGKERLEGGREGGREGGKEGRQVRTTADGLFPFAGHFGPALAFLTKGLALLVVIKSGTKNIYKMK